MYRLPVCVCLIRRMSPCDLTFHITTLARAGASGVGLWWGGRQAGCPSLSAQHRQAGGPHPYPLQNKDKYSRLPPPPPHSTEAPVTATCTLPHTPAGAFSRMCPEPVLNGCLPTPPHCVCRGLKSRWAAGAGAQRGPQPSQRLARTEHWETAAGQ